MSKISIIQFAPNQPLIPVLTPHAIMRHLKAQAIHDFGTSDNPSREMVRELVNLATRNPHVAVLTIDITNSTILETLEELIKRDGLNIELSFTSYDLICGQIMQTQVQKLDLSALEKRIINTAIENAIPKLKPTGRRKDTGEPVREWLTPCRESKTAAVIVHGPQGCGKTTNRHKLAAMLHCDVIQDEQKLDVINHRFPPHRTLFLANNGVEQLVERLKSNAVSRGEDPATLRIELYEYDDLMKAPAPERSFPHAPVNFEVPHKKANVRGVAHGATMYAMGLVEGMMVGDRYITLIVNGDDDVKKIFIDYPFVNWDSGRVQVRTVSEVLMVNAEDQAALGYAEWVADVTPDNLNALLELDRWQHFVAVLSGDKFDRFAKDYSQ